MMHLQQGVAQRTLKLFTIGHCLKGSLLPQQITIPIASFQKTSLFSFYSRLSISKLIGLLTAHISRPDGGC